MNSPGGAQSAAAGPVPLARYVEWRSEQGRAAFLAANPHPVLLVQLGQAELDDGALRTEVITSRQAARGRGWDFVVIPVAKRKDDAFKNFIWVGRAEQCDVPMPFETISKLQAQFVKKGAGYELLDVGSTNGTFVGDHKLERNKPVPVGDGAELRFGQVRARFCLPERFANEVELAMAIRT
jgi:hypothetical protein